MSISSRDDFQVDNQNQDDDNVSPTRDSSSESSSSSIDITDDCFNDIQQRLYDADITAEDHLRVRVYLQPGMPGSYNAEELTSLIASMPDASSKSVHLYLHHFTKNSPPQYAALLETYKAKQALNDKKVFRKVSKWRELEKRVESFSQLAKAEREILADILFISTLDLGEQQASSSVRNVVLMDRSVSDNVRAVLVQAFEEYKLVLLGKYDIVLQPPVVETPVDPRSKYDIVLDPPVVERPVEPRTQIDQRLFLETANQIYAEDAERGMLFIKSFTNLALSFGRGSALSPTATPPHTHSSFETQSTPGLKRVKASDSTDDDELFAKSLSLSAAPSSGGLFGVDSLNKRTSVGAITTASSATTSNNAFAANKATAKNDTVVKRF